MPTKVHPKMIDENTGEAFDDALIPDLAASKIVSGTFNIARVPSLPASKIASGTLSAARIPVAPASASAGVGFGGFRYVLSGSDLYLYTT